MSRLPRISGRDAVAAFRRLGYEVDRQRGSHIVLRNARPPHRRLTVPDHRQLATGTLRALIREAGITLEDFIALLSQERAVQLTRHLFSVGTVRGSLGATPVGRGLTSAAGVAQLSAQSSGCRTAFVLR